LPSMWTMSIGGIRRVRPFSCLIWSGWKCCAALKSTQNNGWQTNVVDGQKLNDTDNIGYRAQVAMDIAGGREVLISLSPRSSV